MRVKENPIPLLKRFWRSQKGSTVVSTYILALILAISVVLNIFMLGGILTRDEWARTNEHISIDTIYFDQGYNLIFNVIFQAQIPSGVLGF
jgi:hypothetical protein